MTNQIVRPVHLFQSLLNEFGQQGLVEKIQYLNLHSRQELVEKSIAIAKKEHITDSDNLFICSSLKHILDGYTDLDISEDLSISLKEVSHIMNQVHSVETI